MNLDHLLQAGLELEKRIAIDHALRKCFSDLWQKSDALPSRVEKSSASTGPDSREIKVKLPAELWNELVSLASQTGKTPSDILQESLSLYRRTRNG